MKLPTIHGLIDRRILVNYRVDPAVLAAQLPAPFRPKVVNGWGMAGICLIRLKQLRPARLPRWVGIRSENAAHRTAVEWDEKHGATREGVFIRRRDTDSWFNTLTGGRLFPGRHHHAQFAVNETAQLFDIALSSDDGVTELRVRGRVATAWPAGSTFASINEASAFFQAGALGYSPKNEAARFDGLELQCHNWHVEPLAVDEMSSRYFNDPAAFPPGSIEFDCALLMRGVEHQWVSHADLCCSTGAGPETASFPLFQSFNA